VDEGIKDRNHVMHRLGQSIIASILSNIFPVTLGRFEFFDAFSLLIFSLHRREQITVMAVKELIDTFTSRFSGLIGSTTGEQGCSKDRDGSGKEFSRQVHTDHPSQGRVTNLQQTAPRLQQSPQGRR